MNKLIITLFVSIFLVSCSSTTDNVKNTWQNEENINNIDTEWYIERGDEWKVISDSPEIQGETIDQDINSTGEDPFNL